jgi:hypothetical protein
LQFLHLENQGLVYLTAVDEILEFIGHPPFRCSEIAGVQSNLVPPKQPICEGVYHNELAFKQIFLELSDELVEQQFVPMKMDGFQLHNKKHFNH